MKIAAKAAKCPPNPGRLVDLYYDALAVYDRFHDFLAEAAKASPTGLEL